MEFMLTVINAVVLIGLSSFFLLLGISSVMEKEPRAAKISFLFFGINGLVWIFFLFAPSAVRPLNVLVIAGFGLFGLLSLARFFPGQSPERDDSDVRPYDERDNMFARNNLQHYPELMADYYEMRPENRSVDAQIHAKPEFGDKAQVFHHDLAAPAYIAAFKYLERAIPLSDGDVAAEKKEINRVEFARTLSEFARFYGACDIGFTRLKPYHFYSHRGRHARHWGEKTDQDYCTAIVIVVPMRVPMLRQAPTGSVIQESAQKYVEVAKIASITAEYIRDFGYRARAHTDANYDTLCVPAAVASGMGELGRMGLFMHRVFGPCVRLALVTTELELPDSPNLSSPSMGEFCKICKKCADNCPSGSIRHGPEPVSRNTRHWSISQEKCFSYWKTIGTDCGLCIAVCPYTKPDTLIHKLVRFYISRNVINQRIALFMDDLLYGRKKSISKVNPKQIFYSDKK